MTTKNGRLVALWFKNEGEIKSFREKIKSKSIRDQQTFTKEMLIGKFSKKGNDYRGQYER